MSQETLDVQNELAQIPPEILSMVDKALAGKKARPITRLQIAQQFLRRNAVAGARQSHDAQKDRAIRERTMAVVGELRKAAVGGIVNPNDASGNPLETRVHQAVSSDQPIQAVMFWGAGHKASMGGPEEELIGATTRLIDGIRGAHSKGVTMGVILADVHVANNGYGEFVGDHGLELSESARTYYDQVRARFAGLNLDSEATGRPVEFRTVFLSDLYRQNGLALRNGGPTSLDREITAKHADLLVANAGLHSRANLSPEESALSYVAMRRREKPILEATPNAVLLAPSISMGAGDIILPQGMPGVFLGGRAPWFQN